MISVIIPSYNSEKTIERTITSLKKQTYSGSYEIILVDSSIDRTPEIVRNNFSDIKYFHLEKKTDPGTARNFGVKRCKGEIILFIDSDCIADPEWIEILVNLHHETNYAAIGGAVINGNNPKNNVAWAGYMAEFREFLPGHGTREISHIATCNISYKKKHFDSLGGFHPDYYPQEDMEFNYRLTKSGEKILFYPKAQIRHFHRSEFWDFVGHQSRFGKITSRMLKKLDIEGSSIARSKVKALTVILVLPFVKWIRTVFMFIRFQPKTVFNHPMALLIFFIGLLPWSFGFIKGVFDTE